MRKDIKKIAILTGGGDCPGLNAVIRSIVNTAVYKYGLEVVGIKNGYRGLYLGGEQIVPLTPDTVSDIIGMGGTILYNSNKDNLFKYPRRNKDGLERDENGKIIYDNLSQVAVDNLNAQGIDAMFILGGDGTLTSARDYSRMGVKVIGIPKTIDNDLKSTDVTFGFDTAVNRCLEGIEFLKTTGHAHHRVMVLEVMGRDAGHIALHTAIASGSDVALIPEIKYDINKVVEKIKAVLKSEKGYATVVVAEGASAPDGGKQINITTDFSPDGIKYGGVGDKVAKTIEAIINSQRDENGYAISETIMDVEARAVSIGHICRGGSPSASDRILCTRYGTYAVEALMELGKTADMVALRDGELTTVPLEDVITSSKIDGNFRPVDPDGELVKVARMTGICFGD